MSETYIAILRGINVSGQRMIKMTDLKTLCLNLGFEDVQTYIQSGNIVFRTGEDDELEELLTQAIKRSFGHDVPVIVMRAKEWAKLVRANPFIKDGTKDPAHLHVTVLSSVPDKARLDKISELQFGTDEFICKGRAVYLHLPGGYGTTKLSNSFFESKLKLKATTRNWKTMNELLTMAGL